MSYKFNPFTGTFDEVDADNQNLWETITADTGSTTADTTTDNLTVAGGTGISTSITGDTLTITNDSPNADQNLWETITGDTGSDTADSVTDSLAIVGGTGISTAVTANTVTITNDSPNVDQNLWETITADTGSAVANTTTDSLGLLGGNGISTSISGDDVTFTVVESELDASALGGSFTAGSALFADTDGSITENNANLFWDETNNFFGIGTNSPSATLTVNSQMTVASDGLALFVNSSIESSSGSPASIQSNATLKPGASLSSVAGILSTVTVDETSGGSSFNVGSTYAGFFQVNTGASYTGTLTNVNTIFINNPSISGGSATNIHGLRIGSFTQSCTNAYGVRVVGPTGGSNKNYAYYSSSGEIVFNDSASDSLFRIEGQTDSNLFCINANRDSVGIGTQFPNAYLHIRRSGQTLNVLSDTNDNFPVEFQVNANRSGAAQLLGGFKFFWNNTAVAQVACRAGLDTTNKDDGQIRFETSPDAGTGLKERMRVDQNGVVTVNPNGDSSGDFVSAGDTDANLFTTDASTETVGVGIARGSHNSKLHVEQASTTGAKPVITISQKDLSEQFIELQGESAADNSQSLVDAADLTTPGSIVGWFKVKVTDDASSGAITDGTYYVPFYSTPTA